MHFTSLLTTLALMATAPTTVLGWAQDGRGVWVANNKVYGRVGNFNNVHESCTRMNSQQVYTDKRPCAYWVNAQGKQQHGYCENRNNRVDCVAGCPDPFSPCQYANTDGSCTKGYAGCLQKMGCDGRSGGADCIGTATGCSVCR